MLSFAAKIKGYGWNNLFTQSGWTSQIEGITLLSSYCIALIKTEYVKLEKTSTNLLNENYLY